MKVVNFWKTLFCAALAVTAFSACSDDDEEGGYSGMPEITVNGGESVTVAGKLEGGKLEQTVEVVSKGDWTLTFKNPGDSQWVTPSAMSGKTGTTQLTFTLGQASGERSAILVLTASSMVEGFPLTDEATITVVQSDSDVPTGNALYSENCGTKVEKVDGYWPYVDKFEGWTRGGSLDQKAVTYTGNSASVANSGKVFDPAEDETTVVTGPPYVSMNKSTSVFNINDINIASNTNFTFTFTAAQQINYSNGVVLGDMTDETIRFSVSTDGSSYAPVALKVKKVASGYWYLCTAEFKLPAGVSTDKIWVRFDGYAGLENHGLRIDDFKLYEGGNGSEIVIPGPVDPELSTIGDIKTAGTYKVKDAIVVTRSEMAYVIADNTGSMLVYHSGNERSVGDKINISGAVTIYQAPNNPPQFDKEAAVEVVSTGNAWNYDFKEYSVDDVNAYFNNIVCTPIILKGKVVKEESNGKTFYNLELDGADATVLQGSVQYYTPDADKLDVPVAVKGYAVGKSQAGNITRIKIFPYEITVNSTEPYITATAPATFKAEGETINVAFNAGNLGSNKVFAKIEGTDAGQFTLGAVGANSVPVTAKANDGAAKSAKLTLYVAASEGAAAVKTTSVDLKQAAKPSGNDTKGTYTSMDGMLPTTTNSDNASYAEKAKINGSSDQIAILKLGTGKKTGVFTTEAVGVSGNKKLSFYAAAWNKASATLYVRVNGGGTIAPASIDLTANSGVAGTAPYTITFNDDTEYFTFDVTGLTATSTLTFSTSANFDASSNTATGRALVAGIQIY